MKRFFIPLAAGVLLLIAASLYLSKHKGTALPIADKPSSGQMEAQIVNTNTPQDPSALQSQANEQAQHFATAIGVTPEMNPEQVRQKVLEWYQSQAAKLVPEQKPVRFYGKAIDEQMQPVSGASVHFIWSDASKSNGTSEADAVSSRDGAFSLTTGIGSRINVYVSKEGYYESKSQNWNDFDVTGNGSSKENPVIFHFRRKGTGADLITSKYGVNSYIQVTTPPDGSPVKVDFFNRKVGQDGQLAISQVKPIGGGQNATGWSCRLAIPGGGLVETTDSLPFEAPLFGYEPAIEFNFQRGSSNWTEILDKTFYIVFGNPPRYGRIHIETSMRTGTILEYAINPDGSRNLEPRQ